MDGSRYRSVYRHNGYRWTLHMLHDLVPQPTHEAIGHRSAGHTAFLATLTQRGGQLLPTRLVANQAPGRFDQYPPQLGIGAADQARVGRLAAARTIARTQTTKPRQLPARAKTVEAADL